MREHEQSVPRPPKPAAAAAAYPNRPHRPPPAAALQFGHALCGRAHGMETAITASIPHAKRWWTTDTAIWWWLFVGMLLILGPLVFGMAWGMQRNLKASRQSLIDAVAAPTTRTELLTWSEARLNDSLWKGSVKGIPPSLSAAGVHYAQKITEGQTQAIELGCGGADNHYGLIVCLSPELPKGTWPMRGQIADHVWFYDELSLGSPTFPRRGPPATPK